VFAVGRMERVLMAILGTVAAIAVMLLVGLLWIGLCQVSGRASQAERRRGE
jgi:hypothetical protein